MKKALGFAASYYFIGFLAYISSDVRWARALTLVSVIIIVKGLMSFYIPKFSMALSTARSSSDVQKRTKEMIEDVSIVSAERKSGLYMVLVGIFSLLIGIIGIQTSA